MFVLTRFYRVHELFTPQCCFPATLSPQLIPAFNVRMFLTTVPPLAPPSGDSYSYVTHEYSYGLITFCFLSTRCIRTLFPASIVL